MNNRIGKYKIFTLPLLFTLITFIGFNGCDVSEPDELIQPGRVKIELKYHPAPDYDLDSTDFLFLQASNIKIYKDQFFADVFQHPDQFLEYTDSLRFYNMFWASAFDELTEVAYGSVPPQTYDSLVFQIAPLINQMGLNYRLYPVVTSYESLPIENNFSKVVKIKSPIKVEQNKTTKILVEFRVEENLFRVLDNFVFSAEVDTFYISNE